MMDFYYALLPITVGVAWVTGAIILLALWTVFGICFVQDEELKTKSGEVIGLGDMMFASFVLILLTTLGGLLAGVFCPVTFPILCGAWIVVGFKIHKDFIAK